MNLGGLGAALSGAVSGYDQGLDIQKKRLAMRQAQEAQQARAAVARGMMQPGGQQNPLAQIPGVQPLPSGVGPQPPPPGVASQPSSSPMGAAPGGGSPPMAAPQGGPQISRIPQGGPPPIPQGGPPPMAPQTGGAAPPAQADGGALPAPPGQGAGGAAPPQMSGVAQPSGNFIQDTQSTLKSIYQNIARASPGIKPEQLFEAANMQLEQMKGVEPDTKLYMQSQIAEQKIDMAAKVEAMKADSAADVAKIKAESSQQIAEMRAEVAKQIAELKDAGATTRTGMNVAGRENVAGTQAKARLGAAALGANAHITGANISAGAKDRATTARSGDVAGTNQSRERQGLTAAQAKENAAAIAMGKPPPYKLGEAGSGGGGAPQYKSAQDVAAAYKSGKLTRDKAAELLKQNGWAQ